MTTFVEDRVVPIWSETLLIDGQEIVGNGPALDVLNPATEQILASVPEATTDQVDEAVAAARRAFDDGPWPRMRPSERSALLYALADEIEGMADQLAAGCISEIGTPVTMAQTLQTAGAVATLRVYADLAARDWTRDLEATPSTPNRGRVHYLPTGVAGVITAYNIPLAIAARSMGAALAAGSTAVLLPSARAPLSSLLMSQAAGAAGLPAGVINVVLGGPEIGRHLTSHPGVDKIAFTGSVAVGQQIMAQAAPSLKRLSLELGGKAPTIMMPGVDLAPVVRGIHARYVRNAGQGCMTPGRLLVHTDAYDEFVALSREVYSEFKTGNPWDSDTDLGPLIRPEHLAGVRAKVDDALDRGATLLAESPPTSESAGWYMSPVLVGDVAPDSPIAQQEIFGPVGVVLPYHDLEEAVRIANATQFGLAADIYCSQVEEALPLTRELRCGAIMINGTRPRPGVPMGGFKLSGFGREGGEWGVHEFLETQYVQWPA